MTETALRVEGLNVTLSPARVRGTDARPLEIVRGVSLDLAPGERLGLVGESGCGKTTVLLAIMDLLPSSACVTGRIYVDGESTLTGDCDRRQSRRWSDVAMVFQGAMNALNPVKTIEWQIAEPIRVHLKASGEAARERARELLELVGIPQRRSRAYPHELSGGMRQRVALAMALACSPTVLLADEPTTALDVMVQAQVLDLLGDIARELSLATILVSHDLALVSQFCSRVLVMYSGRVVEAADSETIALEARHPYARMLADSAPDLYGDSSFASIPGAPPPPDALPGGCAFAPRCPYATDLCAHLQPKQRAVAEPDHRVECHFAL